MGRVEDRSAGDCDSPRRPAAVHCERRTRKEYRAALGLVVRPEPFEILPAHLDAGRKACTDGNQPPCRRDDVQFIAITVEGTLQVETCRQQRSHRRTRRGNAGEEHGGPGELATSSGAERKKGTTAMI